MNKRGCVYPFVEFIFLRIDMPVEVNDADVAQTCARALHGLAAELPNVESVERT